MICIHWNTFIMPLNWHLYNMAICYVILSPNQYCLIHYIYIWICPCYFKFLWLISIIHQTVYKEENNIFLLYKCCLMRHICAEIFCFQIYISWCRHQMAAFSALLVICTENSPHQGKWRGAFMFSFICTWINGWARWCETSSRSLWRHCNIWIKIFDTPTPASITIF